MQASEFKKGTRVELEGEPYVVVEYSTQSPSARGAATLVKAKLRNLRTKQLISQTFKASDTLREPDFELRPCQYLYDEGGETYYFMDDENYEQYPVKRADIEREIGFLKANDPVRVMMFQERVIGIELPHTVILEVTDCEPAVKGDTVTNVTKTAKMETNLEIQVPLFVEQGDKLVVDTRESRYVRRA